MADMPGESQEEPSVMVIAIVLRRSVNLAVQMSVTLLQVARSAQSRS